jgi:hypothetical protein
MPEVTADPGDATKRPYGPARGLKRPKEKIMARSKPPVKVINLETTHCKIILTLSPDAAGKLGGSIESNLKTHAFAPPDEDDRDTGIEDTEAQVTDAKFETAADTLESLVLSLACAGIDVTTSHFKEGLDTSIESIANNLE